MKKNKLRILLSSCVLVIVCLLAFTSCDKENNIQSSVSKTFVLVHSAFQGPYAWQFVTAKLETT